MKVWIWSLLSVGVVSLASLVGLVTLSLREARVRQMTTLLVSFATGALLGDAFIHLVPASFDQRASTKPSLLILAGMLLFFLVEKLLRHPHGPLHRFQHAEPGARPELAAINVVGDVIHNFIDGVVIAASYIASPALGVTTSIAVLCHEVPQELGDFGILVHSGLSARKAMLVNVASASVAVLGAVCALLIGSQAGDLTGLLVPVTAGGFVYIAAADLIPELQNERTLRALVQQMSLISAGMLVMAALKVLEGE